MPGWIVSSESDIERVWREVDDAGVFTSTVPYVEYITRPTDPTNPTDNPLATATQAAPSARDLSHRHIAQVAGISAATTIIIELGVHILGHLL